MNKMERKIGKYAIPNLIIWLIGAYVIGFMLALVAPNMLSYLNFQPAYILHGQVWRLVTWIFQPTDTNVLFMIIMMFFYFQLGRELERTWGTFRFNVYIFGGIIMTAIGGIIAYLVIYLLMGSGAALMASSLMGGLVSTTYINMSIFLAFAVMYPNMQVMLYFIIPIKMKWMAYVYIAVMGYNLVSTYVRMSAINKSMAGFMVAIMLITMVMSLLNFLIFFLSTRNLKRVSPKEIHRRQVYRAQTREPRPGSGITKHKCAVCGRTELDDPTLEFRFCSKCDGNYEYCQEHLFTHQHIRHN